jgi:hypothetical protein
VHASICTVRGVPHHLTPRKSAKRTRYSSPAMAFVAPSGRL